MKLYEVTGRDVDTVPVARIQLYAVGPVEASNRAREFWDARESRRLVWTAEPGHVRDPSLILLRP